MTPKEYLMQIKYLDDEINTKLELVSSLRLRVGGLSSPKLGDKVQTSDKKDFSSCVDKIIDEEEMINKKIDELVDLKRKINEQIDSLDNPLHRIVLINYYILDHSLGDIARIFNYEPGYIRHVHGWALEAFRNKHKDLFD